MHVERTETLSTSQRDDLHRRFQNEWWTADRDRADVDAVLAGSDAVVAFADAETAELVAFARAIADGVYKAFVFDVIVAPERRNEGLGERLMDAILEHPVVADVEHVELYCREAMVPFYERWEFEADLGDLVLARRVQ
jgi:GNAT superfamily N-acetyltransferase